MMLGSLVASTFVGMQSANAQQQAAKQAEQQALSDSIDKQNKIQQDAIKKRSQAQATALGGAVTTSKEVSQVGGTLLTDVGTPTVQTSLLGN